MDCSHEGSGTLYEVGEAKDLETLGEVPWNTLGPGDMVRVHWREEPYREKVLISTRGEEGAPIRLCGAPGPEGQIPVLDADSSTTSPNQLWHQWMPLQDEGLIMIAKDDVTGYESRPGHIVIEGLELRGAKQDVSYTASDGSTRTFTDSASCVYVAHGDHVTVRGSILSDCGNGMFVLSKSEIEETLSREILFEGNVVYGNGTVGSYRQHNAYIQALGTVVQYNYFGPPREGSEGTNLKDRSAGTVVRYNWFDGGSRVLDLVDAQEHAPDAKQDPRYRETFVYGNVLLVPPEVRHPIHYGGDTVGYEQNFRKGVLYFYNNTVVLDGQQEITWVQSLMDASTTDEVVDLRNNVIWMRGDTQLQLMRFSGILRVGTNWISSGWQHGTDEFDGSITGTEKLIEGDAPGLAEETMRPVSGAPVIDAAQELDSAVLPQHDVTMEYAPVATGKARERNGNALDLGAYEGP